MSRDRFVYDNGYGMTTDIYMLDVGTKFSVNNGAWDGEIIEVDGKKYVHVIETGRKVELKPDVDYGLSLYNISK